MRIGYGNKPLLDMHVHFAVIGAYMCAKSPVKLDYKEYSTHKNLDLIWNIGPQKMAYIPSQDLASRP